MKNKKIGVFVFAVLLAVFVTSSVMALAVAIPYWDKPEWYPLKLSSGESKTIQLTLQNTGERDAIVRAALTSGSEIATLVDENLDYSVPSGEVEKQVNVKIQIPENPTKETYEVVISFKQISDEEGGVVSLVSGITAKFPVEVVDYEESILREDEARAAEASGEPAAEKKKPMNTIALTILAVAILIILGIITAIVIRRNKKALKNN